jgi:6-phosphogluconolactonase/glucosamine-6-phosphate isomerase/deaminase
MLRFYHANDGLAASASLAQRLLAALEAGQRTLWLVPGGSNITLSVNVLSSIPSTLQQNLTVMQTDERYGEFDHADSNWRQLREAGFVAENAGLIPVLTPANQDLQATTASYAQALAAELAATEVVIGQFGIGADGHIAGIKPRSPASASPELVCGYQAEDFARITLAPLALQNIHAAYALVFGGDKKSALEKLRDQDLPLTDQPAQILKQMPESYVYTDQIKGAS